MNHEAGYAGKILRVDLSSGNITLIPTQEYATRFLGGRGIAAKIYWDEVSPETRPFDPENRLLFFTGPLAGFPGLAGSRWQVCGKSPITEPEHFCYSNLGGSWGAQLKLAGYDGVVIQGKSDSPVYLFIQDSLVQIRDASSLWGKGAAEVREAIKTSMGNSVRVVATGPAGDHLVSFASLLADNDASGSSGFGAVMGSKKLKAIAVRGSGSVKAAQPERLRELADHIRKLKEGGTRTQPPPYDGVKMKREACYGCIQGCFRSVMEAADGSRGKYFCGSAIFYHEQVRRYYGELNEVVFRANRLCDNYGLDALVVMPIITWLSRCHRAGILNDDNTGIPLSRLGSLEFIETLTRKIALKEGFGEVLAQGPVKAAQIVGKEAQELITDLIIRAGQNTAYGPRLYVTTGLLYATEPRMPIQQLHEISLLVLRWLRWARQPDSGYLSSSVLRAIARRFWGSEIAADFSTYEGKALAAKKIQDRQYAKESLILCDYSWPIIDIANSESHVGDPTLESQVFSAVTGREVDEEGLYHYAERVFNLQRAILVREGHRGRESDQLPEYCYTMPLKTDFTNPECKVPGKDGEVISKKGAVVDREKFEQMKTEYYQFRGWDIATGLLKKEKLEELELRDIAVTMENLGLLV